ncbi:MAG: T9SS type A sorting domain-containing protein [Bacteroidetes bacterium]|nr:T9SS type A sorting domain-containing protein [Bacteroidota bacterium]
MKKSLLNLKSVLLAVGMTGIFSTAVAQQEKHCGTDQALQQIFAKYPELKAQHEQTVANMYQQIYSNQLAAKTATTVVEDTLYIPIVFHIIHQYGAEDISDAQVIDEVSILNRDYMKHNADTTAIIAPYVSVAARTRIQFRLANLDPQGNCTNGIEHIYSHMTNNADDFSKLSGWPQNKYLNVWVVKTIGSAGVAGYAFYPSAIGSPFMIGVDGVLILSDYIGSIGTGTAFTSRALTHEIGHYLGLPHTWGDTNNPGVACGDEGIYDTPMTKGHSSCTLYDAVCDITNMGKKYLFTGATVSSGTVDPTPITYDTLIKYGSFKASGVSSNPVTAGQWSFNNWATGSTNGDTSCMQPSGALDPSKYYEVTLSPKLGVNMNITSINFNVQRSATGPRSFAVRSSVDGYTNNLNIITTYNTVASQTMIAVAGSTVLVNDQSTLTYSISSTSNTTVPVPACSIYTVPNTGTLSIPAHHKFMSSIGGKEIFITKDTTAYLQGAVATVTTGVITNSATATPVTYRFYAWNAEDAAGSFRIDTVLITGTLTKIENVQNYMEYSYCSNMFTRDQKTVMRFSLHSNTASRANLVSDANHVATGTTGTGTVLCSPIADFKASTRSVCQGTSVLFTALPRNATATTYSWTFANGTPATSTSSVPSVVFNAQGWQQVSLTVGNSAGSNTKTETQYIYVSPNYADITGPYNENVETSTAGNWIIDNPENNSSQFVITGNAGSSGSHSFFLNCLKTSSDLDPFYDQRLGENNDAIISPKYNLNYVTSATLSFKYSCVSRGGSSAQITEKLTVYKSTDCGKTWNVAGNATNSVIKGAALANAGYASGSFVPSASQWASVNIPLTLTSGQGNVRFKFEYHSSDVSNCIYIDDININGTVGIEESVADYFNLNVYPNPSQSGGDINVDYLSHGKKVVITITDMLGRQVYTTTDENQTGAYSKKISGSESKLRSGMYFVSVSDGTNNQIKKIIIN